MVPIIIVDYNSIDKTIEYIDNCILNIIDNEKIMFVIVDNFSKENKTEIECYIINLEIIEEKNKVSVYKGVYNNHILFYIKTGENLGYAKGNNLGVKIISKYYSFDNLIISNNDLKFERKFNTNEFLEIFDYYSDIGVIGPKIIGINGNKQSPRKEVGIFKQLILYFYNILLFNLLSKLSSNIDYDNTSKYTYWVNGCFLIISYKKFIECDMFDENTFLFAEEMILSERMLKKHYKNYFYNDLTLIHEHNYTIKNSYSVLKSMDISFQSNYYYFKEYKRKSIVILTMVKYNYWLFKQLFNIQLILKKQIKKLFK